MPKPLVFMVIGSKRKVLSRRMRFALDTAAKGREYEIIWKSLDEIKAQRRQQEPMGTIFNELGPVLNSVWTSENRAGAQPPP